MSATVPDLSNLLARTAIVTGGANGIGAQTVKNFYELGANVVIADVASSRDAARELLFSLPDKDRAMFVPTDITVWADMQNLFNVTIERFEKVDVVVANAGIMESKPFFDLEMDENGSLKEPTEAYKVIDVNLKGTANSKSPSHVQQKALLLLQIVVVIRLGNQSSQSRKRSYTGYS